MGGTVAAVLAFNAFTTRHDGAVDSALKSLSAECRRLHRLLDRTGPLTPADKDQFGAFIPYAEGKARALAGVPDLALDLHEAAGRFQGTRSRLLELAASTADEEKEARKRLHDSFPYYQAIVDRAGKRWTARAATLESNMRSTVIVISLLNALFVVIGIWAARRFVVRPVFLLGEGVARIDEGDYTYRVPVVTEDELGDLTNAFNRMSEHLDENIRALRKSEEDLKQKASELQAMNSELEQYAYAASHDLQEPLRTVTTYSQLLAAKHQNLLEPEAAVCLTYIQSGAARMRQLIRDLLSYSRGLHAPANAVLTDAEAAFRAAVNDCRIAIEETGATIRCDALPRVLVDPADLEIVFQNLLSNALKYRREVPPEIVASASVTNGSCELRVQDNGMGIPPEYHERIFGLFKRLHGSDVPGTGIGLALTRRIIEKHGGRIRVDSTSGQGSVFVFTLPAADSSAVAASV